MKLAQRLRVATGQALCEATLCAIAGGHGALHLAMTLHTWHLAVRLCQSEVGALDVRQTDHSIRPSEESLPRNVLAAAVALSMLAAAPAAAQASDTLASGTTMLKLDAGVAKALKGAGVSVSGTTYKITGGSLDGATGTIKHSGSLRLKAGSTKLTLSSFTVKLGKQVDAQRAGRQVAGDVADA